MPTLPKYTVAIQSIANDSMGSQIVFENKTKLSAAYTDFKVILTSYFTINILISASMSFKCIPLIL